MEITVKLGSTRGTPFTTNIGTPQGDCLSPTLFTLYLAKALKTGDPLIPQELILDHSYSRASTENYSSIIPQELMLDHSYSKISAENHMQKSGFFVDLQYADDIGWLAGNHSTGIEHQKLHIPKKLEERNLNIKLSKSIVNREHKDGL